ncbi:unnamed protein product [Taenia asiatica]|uniref:Cupin_2 domain-containing protein n=1 Tax=Taenia asiatica TaxID=60517 RepID=A0A3P6QIC8_TAEAS|nr:unnamed protein product [Taenia asiatica]
MVWDPACFGGVESIHVPAEDLWRPDIVLYNNADGKYEITTLTRAEVFFNGTVRWMPPALYLSACRIDMEYFPYDEQICSMRFSSWTYDGSKGRFLSIVDLRHHLQKYAPELLRPLYIDYAADLHDFGSTIEYDVISVSAVCYDRMYQHSPHPYPEVVFQFRMRRRTVFHTFNLLLPCVAVAVLAVMTFLLPPECREKISLSITTLLALTLFFLLISKTAPPTSLAVPLIGKYLLFTIVLITSSILLTVVVLNVHFRSAETHSMGKWMRRIFLEVLPPLLGLQPPKQTKKAMKQMMLEIVSNKWAIQKTRTPRRTECRLRDHRDSNYERKPDPLICQISRQLVECCSDEAQTRLQRKLHQVAEGSKFIEQRLRVSRREKDVSYIGYKDEVNQILTTNVWVELEWTDSRLIWEPEDFGGVTALFIPSEQLWLPDLLLYNNADGTYVIDIMTKAMVFHNGTVKWTPPAIFKSSCPINVQYFPYDIQECSMKFGSWTYNGHEVSLKHITQKRIPEHEGNVHIDHAIILKAFYPSVEFELLQVSAIRRAEYYTCCKDPFIDVTFKLALRRKTLFYTINLIIPCVGIAFLTILVFYLPSQSGGKIALSINVLLGLTVFLLLLTESIPPTGLAMPLIGKYLLFTMGLVSLSILNTIFVLNLHNRTPNRPAPTIDVWSESSTWSFPTAHKTWTVSHNTPLAACRLINFSQNLRTLAKHFSKLEAKRRVGICMGDLKITHWDVNTDGVFSEGKLKEKLEKEGFTVIPYTFSPGTVFPDHTHVVDKKDGITAGKFSFTMHGKTVILSAGDTIFVPKNTVHASHVVGDEDVHSQGPYFSFLDILERTMPEFVVHHWDEAEDGVLSRATMKAKLQKMGYSATPYTFGAGNVFGTHTHDADKMDVVVDGELEFSMYGKSIVLKSGDALEIPKGEPHSAKVLGNKKLEFFDATKL